MWGKPRGLKMWKTLLRYLQLAFASATDTLLLESQDVLRAGVKARVLIHGDQLVYSKSCRIVIVVVT